MDLRVLRSWWFEKQGLMHPDAAASPAQILASTGWSRSVGGANPYLTLFARGGVSREAADAAVANLEIHELPCARGCTYVVPKQDYALALKVGQGFSDEAAVSTAKKFLGVTEEELSTLSEKVVIALASGPLDPRELKDAVGDAVRSLGPEGKKRGLTTTLPLSLGRLQSTGYIRRIPMNGRLDQQRYRYAQWSPSPLEGFTLSREEAFVELARRFFRWIGPASLANLQWFTGLGVKASKEAIAPLGLVPLETGSELLLFPDDRDSLLSHQPPSEPVYSLVSGIDGITMLRRDADVLLDSEDRERQVMGDKGIVSLGGLQDLSHHAILDRGRLVGLWEFDPTEGRIAWASFVPRTTALLEAVARTETYCREQLGDVRSFSLDSPESRKPKIEALRAMNGEGA